jgi:GntR family transcriptional regulator
MADTLYLRIADDLRARIDAGELAHGEKLPPEPQLQEEYRNRPEFGRARPSLNTVRDAVEILVLEGLIEKRHGRGTFVAEKITRMSTTLSGNQEGGETAAYASEVASQARDRQETRPEISPQWGLAAPELQLPTRAPVIRRYQERYINNLPYSMQTSFYPQSFVNCGATRLAEDEDIKEGAIRYIRETIGVEQVHWCDRVRVRVASKDEIEFFGLPRNRGAQLIEVRRTGFDREDTPIRLTVTLYAADRNELVYESERSPAPQNRAPRPRAPTRGARRPQTHVSAPTQATED